MYGDVTIKGRGLYSLLHDVFRYFAVKKKHKYIAVTVFEQNINLEDENQVHNKLKSQLLRFTSLESYEARDILLQKFTARMSKHKTRFVCVSFNASYAYFGQAKTRRVAHYWKFGFFQNKEMYK